MARWILLTALPLAALGACNNSPEPAGSWRAPRDCRAGFVCIDDRCVKACNSDAECLSDEHCLSGVCRSGVGHELDRPGPLRPRPRSISVAYCISTGN